MITINLLPPAARQAAAHAQWMTLLPWRRIGLVAAGGLAFYSVGIVGWNQVQARAVSRLTREWDALQPDRARVEQAQTTLMTLRGRASALQALKHPDGQWAPRLNLLSDALVSGLWLTQVRFGVATTAAADGQPPPEATDQPAAPSAPILWLAGSALVKSKGEDAPVKRYLQRLQEHPAFAQWFRGIELKGIEHRQVGQEAVCDFGLVVSPRS
ncbi:MAG: hypothetical protein HY600_07110 [Candidatus Omnitrophica bacterium]|nr:hypothetical protein [Candidatus Omnitrophota bacterium]